MDNRDVRVLYTAFKEVCDSLKSNGHCGDCPMYSSVCSDDRNSGLFAQVLQRIEEEVCE